MPLALYLICKGVWTDGLCNWYSHKCQDSGFPSRILLCNEMIDVH